MQSVVTEREAIAFEIAEIVGDIADKWGVAIEGILIKDIIFSPEVSASLSSAAQQKRIGESKVIAARAEVDSARLMRQAADILASPAAMQIRQLEACTLYFYIKIPFKNFFFDVIYNFLVQSMAKSANSKVIFVPMQLQSDVGGSSSIGALVQSEAAEGSGGLGLAGRAGILNSVADA